MHSCMYEGYRDLHHAYYVAASGRFLSINLKQFEATRVASASQEEQKALWWCTYLTCITGHLEADKRYGVGQPC